MLQALLADRFQLKLHRETKDGPAYALVVAAKGPKLMPTKNPDAFYVRGRRNRRPATAAYEC